MNRRARSPWMLLVGLVAGGCASGPARAARPDALPAGCDVDVLDTLPARATRGVGEVTERCTGDAAGDVARCTRALKDQACALGANVIWAVGTTRNDEGAVMRAYAGRYR